MPEDGSRKVAAEAACEEGFMDTLHDYQLRKFVSPEFIFGLDARFLAARYLRNLGARKVLVVTDPGVREAGWTEDVLQKLREEGLEYALFDGVTSNPRAEEVMEGSSVYVAEKCNCIIAVGGGSPMDCAKGIGIVAASPGTGILQYEGVDEVRAATPPLVCIPTTAGTSADVSQFAIITDVERSLKIAIISKAIVPDAALIDPVTTRSMPRYLTACTAMDALCHGIEAYVSKANSPVSDLHALAGIRLVRQNLLRAVEEPDDLLFRSRMMLGSLHTGLAFSNASLGAVHAMAHSVGGLLDFAHGEANAVLLGPVIRFNFSAAPARYRTIAENFGIGVEGKSDPYVRDALADGVVALAREAGITGTLGPLGVNAETVPELARKALLDPCLLTNPRIVTQKEMEGLYEQAL